MNTSRRGQAVIEYLMIFAFMGIIGVTFVKGMGTMVDETIGSLAHELSQQLSTGVCEKLCFGPLGAYDN